MTSFYYIQIPSLQISSLCFIFPAFLSIYINFYLGFFIYLFNTIISYIVHRPNRLQNHDFYDTLDHILILTTFLYLAFLIIHKFKLLTHYTHIILFIFSLLSSVIILVIDTYRRTLFWRTQKRINVHLIMHVFFILGSITTLSLYY